MSFLFQLKECTHTCNWVRAPTFRLRGAAALVVGCLLFVLLSSI